MSPHTSVSVLHSVVRNKPAYPYPYTESSMQSEGSEDTSYYYTYEDTSEENGKVSSTTPIPAASSTVKAIRSFWNSQKAQLDARKNKSTQKFLPTYSKPTAKAETRPKIEFKVREKPKFGLANKNKETSTEKTVTKKNQEQNVESTTTPKPFKFKANLAIEKDSEKDEVKKGSSKSSGPALENQIVGRIGEIPLQSKFNSQVQVPIRSQSNIVNYQQPALRNNINSLPPLANTLNQQTLTTANNPDPFMIDLTKRSQTLTPNQQSIVDTNQQLQNSIHALLNSNQQAILNLNANQQPPVNTQQQLQQQPILRSNQQQLPLLNNIQQQVSRPAVQTFISTIPADNTAVRSNEQYANTNSPASTLLQRLGSLGLNLGGGDLGGGLVQGRNGGYGGPNGLQFNLGPVPDPLSVLLKLLSLLPRPLLDLNGRLFFGIELGKNAGLVSGVGPKPVGKPIG